MLWNNGENSKIYHSALSLKIEVCSISKDVNFWVQISPKYERITKALYGEKSVEYLKALRQVAFSFKYKRKPQESYKIFLRILDLSKEIFGTEFNQTTSVILFEMAVIKESIFELEDALNIYARAKKWEEKVSSTMSSAYKQIEQMESNCRKKFDKLNKNKVKPYSKSKITAAVFILGALTIGAIYLIKSRKKNE